VKYCENIYLPLRTHFAVGQNALNQILRHQQQPNNPEDYSKLNSLASMKINGEYDSNNTNQSGFNLNRLGNDY